MGNIVTCKSSYNQDGEYSSVILMLILINYGDEIHNTKQDPCEEKQSKSKSLVGELFDSKT